MDTWCILLYVIVCILFIMVVIVVSRILCTKWITKSLKLKIVLLAWGLKHYILIRLLFVYLLLTCV
jgi:hypothetical protein